MKSTKKGKLTISVEILDGDALAAATDDDITGPAVKLRVRMKCGKYGTRAIGEAGPAEYMEQGPVAGIVSALADVLTDEDIMQEVMQMVAEKVHAAHEDGACPHCDADPKSEGGLADMPAQGHA